MAVNYTEGITLVGEGIVNNTFLDPLQNIYVPDPSISLGTSVKEMYNLNNLTRIGYKINKDIHYRPYSIGSIGIISPQVIVEEKGTLSKNEEGEYYIEGTFDIIYQTTRITYSYVTLKSIKGEEMMKNNIFYSFPGIITKGSTFDKESEVGRIFTVIQISPAQTNKLNIVLRSIITFPLVTLVT